MMIMTKLKKTNTKLDKELFIQLIRKEALDNPVNLGDDNNDGEVDDGMMMIMMMVVG